MRSHRIAITLVLTAFTAALLTGCGGRTISTQQEVRLGQQAAQQIESQNRTYSDSRVTRIGQRLAAASERPNLPYRFRVIDSAEVNAVSLPGGPIYVYRGLLNAIGNDEAQLAGVMGHEIAHITRRHAIKRLEAQQTTGAIIGILTRGTTQDLLELAAQIQFLRYSREDEYEADRFGIVYANRGGYDPAGLARFLEQLAARGDGGSIPFLRSHPSSGARAQRARELAADLRTQRP